MEEKRVPEEQRPQCPVYRKCGGCQLQNMSYERQLIWKQDRCRKLLGKFGKVLPILGMERPYHYRNKVQAAFAFDKTAQQDHLRGVPVQQPLGGAGGLLPDGGRDGGQDHRVHPGAFKGL